MNFGNTVAHFRISEKVKTEPNNPASRVSNITRDGHAVVGVKETSIPLIASLFPSFPALWRKEKRFLLFAQSAEPCVTRAPCC